MSLYVAWIVQPDGVRRYLVKGRLAGDLDNATHHSHPSGARRALKDFARRHPFLNYVAGINDTTDLERYVP